MDNKIGNISTIIKIISMTIAGWIISTLAAQGYNLGVDAVTLASVIGAIIGLALAYIDAKYPNTLSFFDNVPIPVEVDAEEPVLNDEYECDNDDSC
jgi:uncharacterized membrane protein YeaQ/YmgE (transglycosylase-associated protein family)